MLQRPVLSLAAPSGGYRTPQVGRPVAPDRRRMPIIPQISTSGSSDASRSRSGSDSAQTLPPSLPPFPDPGSAPTSGGSNSAGALDKQPSVDLEKLRVEKGGALDVEDLDDAGWRAASTEGMIEELGSLGEGAGGAVTRCILKGGKTVFALKVVYHDV